MMLPMTTVLLRTERDVVQSRQRARELAALLNFDNQDQIRIATATSEMARNAFRYAKGGKVEFGVEKDPPQSMVVTISDTGGGIPNIDEIMDGRYRSQSGLGLGILGTRRLMDDFDLQTNPRGTFVKLVKFLPFEAPAISSARVGSITQQMMQRPPESPYEEIERQNQELLNTLQALRERQEELAALNRELEDTNRGVVALYAELDERADYLRRASELKSKFLSNVSHEFRTPLNSIISLSRILIARLEGELTPEQEKQIKYIGSAATSLAEMVNDLLDIAKVEAGKVKLRVKDFEAAELFSALKGMLKPLLADNNSVELIFKDVSSIPALHSDEGKVSQIVRNFVSNAIKFTPQGVIEVNAEATVTGTVIFSVCDSGIGIRPEFQETIFQEFSQVENSLQDRYRGTGLGLPLCRNLAQLLGGRVWLKSEEGKGSTFYLEVPRVYSGESDAGNVSTGEEADSEIELHRAPVVIVEDNHETWQITETFFRKSEFQPLHAADLRQAERLIEKYHPSAVVCDIYLQEQPVWDFLSHLRETHPGLPVIAMSAHDVGGRALSSGSRVFMRKPLERDALLHELRRLTGNQRPRLVLLVDDNEVSRYILREILSQPWLDLVEARNGNEALEAISRYKPDAVVLDMLMPDLSGMEVLHAIRQENSKTQLPVIIYTSKQLTQHEREVIEREANGYIRKDEVARKLSPQLFFHALSRAGISEPAGTGDAAN